MFHRDAVCLGEVKKRLCAEYGFVGLYPLDNEIAADAPELSRTIYASCVTMMAAADYGIFNLTPFRGPSADVGTAVELGMMVAQGKPVFAYTNVADSLIDRLHCDPGLAQDAADVWRDPLGMMAENFGNADNLMLDEALAAQGRNIHRRAVVEAERFENIDGFIACLNEARRHLRPSPPAGA